MYLNRLSLQRFVVFPALALLVLVGCEGKSPKRAPAGNPEEGARLIRQAGCGSCHEIPGVASAQGRVGPPLEGLSQRAYLAGVLPNTFNNLALWLQQPQQVAPGSAMPNTGLSRGQAEDIAAYLYSFD